MTTLVNNKHEVLKRYGPIDYLRIKGQFPGFYISFCFFEHLDFSVSTDFIFDRSDSTFNFVPLYFNIYSTPHHNKDFQKRGRRTDLTLEIVNIKINISIASVNLRELFFEPYIEENK